MERGRLVFDLVFEAFSRGVISGSSCFFMFVYCVDILINQTVIYDNK
jgi:hypothetical protein